MAITTRRSRQQSASKRGPLANLLRNLALFIICILLRIVGFLLACLRGSQSIDAVADATR